MKKAKPSPKLNYLFRKKSVKAAIYNKSEDKTPNEFNASCNSSKLFEANRSLINGFKMDAVESMSLGDE